MTAHVVRGYSSLMLAEVGGVMAGGWVDGFLGMGGLYLRDPRVRMWKSNRIRNASTLLAG